MVQNQIKGLGFYNNNISNPLNIFSLLSSFNINPLLGLGNLFSMNNKNNSNLNMIVPTLGIMSSFMAFSSIPMGGSLHSFSLGFFSSKSFRKLKAI